jgi:sulfur carrier protein
MKISVNSQLREEAENTSLLQLLKKLQLSEKRGIAIAVNAEVAPRKKWSELQLQENDEVLIIEAAQGG